MDKIKGFVSQFIRAIDILKAFDYLINDDRQSVKTNAYFCVFNLVVTLLWLITFFFLWLFMPNAVFSKYLDYFILATFACFALDFWSVNSCNRYHNKRPA
jgi:hypothetical protein